jgi:hypothetical protein
MRDDRLGGRDQLAEVLGYLNKNNLVTAALAEKAEAVRLWKNISALAREIQWPPGETGEFVRISAEYGVRLFRVVECGWRLLAARPADGRALENWLADYDHAWKNYRQLADSPWCSSLYEGRYFALPGLPAEPGLDASVAQIRQSLLVPALK